ncbi:MAG: hypothetical protein ACXWRZ_10635 [Bdellovibrio sp.]
MCKMLGQWGFLAREPLPLTWCNFCLIAHIMGIQKVELKSVMNFKVQSFAIYLSLIAFLLPLKGRTVPIDLDVKDGEVTVEVDRDSGQYTVEGHSASFTVMQGLSRHRKASNAKSCNNSQMLSIREGQGLLGTVTPILNGVYLTARHVVAGKNPTEVRNQNGDSFPVPEVFKKFYQVVNKKTGKPLDLLLISSRDEIGQSKFVEQLRTLISNGSIYSGEKWSSCQLAVHSEEIFSQSSEGEIKLVSDDKFYFYLGWNNLTQKGANSSDLTTFGSSGASVWVNKNDIPTLAGVVSCLQMFQDPASGIISVFPKILSLPQILNTEDYYLQETTLEFLKTHPQEVDPYCPFTDGKGAGGFHTIPTQIKP